MVTAVNSYGESPPSNEVQVLEPLALQSGGSPMAGGVYTIQRLSYAFAGRVIAVRTIGNLDPADDGLHYLHGNHLGSVRMISDPAGQAADGPIDYYPFGDYRLAPNGDLTDRGFTGHRHNNIPGNDLGLITMNARYYVPFDAMGGPAPSAWRWLS